MESSVQNSKDMKYQYTVKGVDYEVEIQDIEGNQEEMRALYKTVRAKGFLKVFSESIWGLMSPVIILGGIFTGYLSVVEAAAVSVVYAVFVSLFIYKSLDLKGIWLTFVDSVKNVASIAMMLAFAVAFTSLMDVFNGGEIMSQSIKSVVSSPHIFVFYEK